MQAVLTTRERDTLDILDGPNAGEVAPQFDGDLVAYLVGRPDITFCALYRREQDETGSFYRYIGPAA
jgi:hypothetical protein